MSWPNEPVASNKLAVWLRKFLRAAKSCEIQPGVGYRVRKTSGGSFLELGPTGGPGGGDVEQFKFVSMASDHLVCHAWDGSTTGTADVKIAKPYKLRFTQITQQVIDSQTITYDNYNTTTQVRVAHIGTTVAETQVIVPRYLTDDVIYAVKPDDTSTTVTVSGTATVLDYLDCNVDGRAWAVQ